MDFVGQNGASGIGTVAVPAPPGLLTGDLEVLMGAIDPHSPYDDAVLTPPGGWTFIQEVFRTNDVRMRTWHKTADAEPGSYSCAVPGATNPRTCWAIGAYRRPQSNPLDVYSTREGGDSGGTSAPFRDAVAGSITPGGINELILLTWAWSEGVTSVVWPSGVTGRRIEQIASGPGEDLGLVFGDMLSYPTATPTGDKMARMSGPIQSGGGWVAQQIAFKGEGGGAMFIG